MEVPPAALDDYMKTSESQTLESEAVGIYEKEKNQAELVPVDLQTTDEGFFNNSQYFFKGGSRLRSLMNTAG